MFNNRMPAVGGAVKIENGQTMNTKSAGRLSSTQLIESITLSKPTGTQEQATNVTNQDSSGLLFTRQCCRARLEPFWCLLRQAKAGKQRGGLARNDRRFLEVFPYEVDKLLNKVDNKVAKG